MHKTGQPVLVGTTSVEQSDSLSEQLRDTGIPHEVSYVYGNMIPSDLRKSYYLLVIVFESVLDNILVILGLLT